jgi:hypothetical protein
MSRNQIFISYSHKDKEWLDLLKINLKPHFRKNSNLPEDSIFAWDDTYIKPGDDWREKINQALAEAKIAILLVSSDFLASDFICDEELPYLFEAAKTKGIRIIPVAVRPSAWKKVAIESLQWANPPDRPLLDMEESEKQTKLVEICEQIASFFSEDVIPPDKSPPEIVNTVSQSAKEGLRALAELMVDPEVLMKVATFKVVFATSSEQIELLGYYKDLHDILHTLQFRCYNYLNGIVGLAKSNPAVSSIWDLLIGYEGDMRTKVVNTLCDIEEKTRLQEEEKKGFLPRGQKWIAQLIQHLEALFKAIKEKDATKIEEALRPIRQVLALRPVPINSSLRMSAETLQLSRLVGTLTDVRKCLEGAQVNPDKLSKFVDGVNAIGELEGSLVALIESHNEWQEIDVILRLIDGNIAIDRSQLEEFWGDLNSKIKAQCDGFEGQLVEQLREEIPKLEAALATKDDGKIRLCFQSFRTAASYRFYEIDSALKELCQQLRKVGEPLTEVWEKVK